MNRPLISIIIPVYNVEKYLRECLDSVIKQTLKNIEIICIDDFSSDTSLCILRQYQSKDDRIKIIAFDSNKSVLQARKAGVEVATGAYLMFLDSDDSLRLNACEKLYKAICKYDVDILHFGTYVNASPIIDSNMVRWFENFAIPYKGFLYGDDLVYYSFRDKKIIWNLWNKIYKTEVCKSAFKEVADLYLNMCEDMYVYFLIICFAQSYMGIDDKFYQYNFGRGMTGERRLYDDQSFNGLCQMAYIVPLLSEFLASKDKLNDFNEVLQIMSKEFANNALSGLCSLTKDSNRVKCMELYIDRFGKNASYESIVVLLNNQGASISKLKKKLRKYHILKELFLTMNTNMKKALDIFR